MVLESIMKKTKKLPIYKGNEHVKNLRNEHFSNYLEHQEIGISGPTNNRLNLLQDILSENLDKLDLKTQDKE